MESKVPKITLVSQPSEAVGDLQARKVQILSIIRVLLHDARRVSEVPSAVVVMLSLSREHQNNGAVGDGAMFLFPIKQIVDGKTIILIFPEDGRSEQRMLG